MALSEVIIPSDGVTTLLTVDFALGYIDVTHITCRAGEEVDGGGDPVYRTFTFISTTLVQVDGAAPPIGQTWQFKRTIPKDELIVNWEDGDAITAENLDTAQKQSIMMTHEALDDVATAIKTADGSDGILFTKGTSGQILVFDIDGNLVPATPDGTGNMLREIYDPQGIGADAFDLSNMTGRLDGLPNLPQIASARLIGRWSTLTGDQEAITGEQGLDILGKNKSIDLRKFRTTYTDPTDWRATIQAAADSGEQCIRVPANTDVTFNDTVFFDTDRQKWVGEGFDVTSQFRRLTMQNTVALHFRGERQGMRHIGVKCNTNVGSTDANIGILVSRPNGEPTDLDFEFRDGYISGWRYGIMGKGRGLSVFYSLISDVRYGIDFGWPDVGTYIKDRFQGDSDTTGFRRQRAVGNEFHSVEVAGIRNRGWNAANIHAIVIGNTSNFGEGIYFGKLGTGTVVALNSVTQGGTTIPPTAGNETAAYLLDGGQNYFFLDNSITGDRSDVGDEVSMSNFVQFTGTHTNGIVDGFRGAYCYEHGIDMRDGDFEVTFRNIDLAEIGLSGAASYSGILVLGNTAATKIYADGVALRNTAAAQTVIRMVTAGTSLIHRDLQALNGATPLIGGAGTSTVASVPGVISTAPIQAPDGSAANPAYTFVTDPDSGMWRIAANTVGYGVNGVEVFRTVAGAILLGRTSTSAAGTGVGMRVQLTAPFMTTFGSGTGATTHQSFYNDALVAPVLVGSISTNGSATAFNTSSDERRKQDFLPIDPALLDYIKVYDFQWKVDGTRGYGVKAQELAEHVPTAVHVDEQDLWSVDYSKLVPLLIATVQELKARVAVLEGT